jgi:hypothetical protein
MLVGSQGRGDAVGGQGRGAMRSAARGRGAMRPMARGGGDAAGRVERKG